MTRVTITAMYKTIKQKRVSKTVKLRLTIQKQDKRPRGKYRRSTVHSNDTLLLTLQHRRSYSTKQGVRRMLMQHKYKKLGKRYYKYL